MSQPDSGRGVWRIGVRGAVTPRAASLLADLDITVVSAATLLQTGAVSPDACASTIAELQSLGLDVIELHWVDTEPGG